MFSSRHNDYMNPAVVYVNRGRGLNAKSQGSGRGLSTISGRGQRIGHCVLLRGSKFEI